MNTNMRARLRKTGALALQALMLSAALAAPQQPESPSRAEIDRLAAQVTRLADAYVAEFVSRFPDVAELNGSPLSPA